MGKMLLTSQIVRLRVTILACLSAGKKLLSTQMIENPAHENSNEGCEKKEKEHIKVKYRKQTRR